MSGLLSQLNSRRLICEHIHLLGCCAVGILVSAANSKDVDDAIDIEMQSDMLIILSSLCEGDIHRKELFGSDGHGIDIVTHYLKMDPTKFTSGLGHHRLMLATVDAVW